MSKVNPSTAPTAPPAVLSTGSHDDTGEYYEIDVDNNGKQATRTYVWDDAQGKWIKNQSQTGIVDIGAEFNELSGALRVDAGLPENQSVAIQGEVETHSQQFENVFGNVNLQNIDGRLKVEVQGRDQFRGASIQYLGQEFGVDCAGQGGATVQLSGTFTGTITFEATADGGNWVAINGQAINGVVAVSSATTVGIFRFNVAGLSRIRARATAAITGVAIIVIRVSATAYDNLIASTVITGTSIVSEATLDPTVRAAQEPIKIAPIVPIQAAAYTSNFLGNFPQIYPRMRVEIGGDQKLPLAQEPQTNRILIAYPELMSIAEQILIQLNYLNQKLWEGNFPPDFVPYK